MRYHGLCFYFDKYAGRHIPFSNKDTLAALSFLPPLLGTPFLNSASWWGMVVGSVSAIGAHLLLDKTFGQMNLRKNTGTAIICGVQGISYAACVYTGVTWSDGDKNPEQFNQGVDVGHVEYVTEIPELSFPNVVFDLDFDH